MRILNRKGKEYANIVLRPAKGKGIDVEFVADGISFHKEIEPVIKKVGDDLIVEVDLGAWGSDIAIGPDDFKAVKQLLNMDIITWAIKTFFK